MTIGNLGLKLRSLVRAIEQVVLTGLSLNGVFYVCEPRCYSAPTTFRGQVAVVSAGAEEGNSIAQRANLS